LFWIPWHSYEWKKKTYRDCYGFKWQNINIYPILIFFFLWLCRNPSLGLATNAKVCKGASQEKSPGVTFHAPGSVRKCEGMNLHIPKWAPTLGVEVLMDSQIFREKLHGSKPIGLKNSLYHWQFDSQPLKVENRPDFLTCKWCATYRWKALDEGYNFSLNVTSIKGLHTKLRAPEIVGFSI
jgi:hypothetical protein